MCRVVTFHSRHLAPAHRPPRSIRRCVPLSPAFQSPRHVFAPLGRHHFGPAALLGFNPSQLFSGRTVPRASSAAEAHVSFPGHILLDGFGRGIGRQNCNRTQTRPIRMHPSRLLGFHPSGQPSSVSCETADSCCPGLCLFRDCGHPLVQDDGLVPAIAHRPSPVPSPAALRS
jgi:hypothetical protein